jgi:hypothetical protein
MRPKEFSLLEFRRKFPYPGVAFKTYDKELIYYFETHLHAHANYLKAKLIIEKNNFPLEAVYSEKKFRQYELTIKIKP